MNDEITQAANNAHTRKGQKTMPKDDPFTVAARKITDRVFADKAKQDQARDRYHMDNETISIDLETLTRLISTARAMTALVSLDHDGPVDSMEGAYLDSMGGCTKTRAWWLMNARKAIAEAEANNASA